MMRRLDARKPCGFQRSLDLVDRISGHSVDDLLKSLGGFIISVGLIDDQELTAGPQNSAYFRKTLLQPGPEVDRLKGRRQIVGFVFHLQSGDVAFLYFASSRLDLSGIIFPCLRHRQGRVIDSSHLRFRIALHQFSGIPAAATANL